jgi:hypothetical protein
MPKNFAGKTYEVLVGEGKRWINNSTHATRSAALEVAEELLKAANHDGVRVVAENERTGEEEILFEESIDRDDKVIKLNPVKDAPLCAEFIDFYRFPARRTAGRLLRNYLDDQGMTALEMIYNPAQLLMFERNDRVFAPAMQRIGAIQAKATGEQPAKRTDTLFKTFDIIKERAKTSADAEKYSALLKAKGLDSLIDGAGQWEKEENREFVIRGAMASHITSCRDGDGKLQLLIGLSRDHPGPEAVAYLDEITAEILDGAAAVMEVLGGQPDAAAANRKLVNLSCGRCQPPKNPISCIVELNDMIARLDMPLTRQVLLERVENEIGGIRPLTREGKTVDREAFAVLVRELAEDDGLMGGPGMGAAVVGRARITLTKGESDLSAEQAIDHLLDLMPNRAVRLGFLLDLAASALFEKEGDVIQQALNRISQQLSFLASLMPDAESLEKVALVVEKLKRRLDNDTLPEDWRQGLSSSLDELVQRAKGGGKKVLKKGTNKYTVDVGKKDMSGPTSEHQKIKAGELIFKENEFDEVAYLVVSGEVEIFRSSGNQEQMLATVGRGEIIGEMSLIDSQPHVASARALSDTQVSLISRQSFQQRLDRLEKSDRVLRRLIGVLVDRLRGQDRARW